MRKLLLISLLLTFSGVVLAQEKVVSGKVIAKEDGQGIPGANISVQGSSKGTVSAVDGSYRIILTASENTLVVSFIGYITQTIQVGERSTIDVVLEMDDKVLDEVVVVGYGVQKKSDLTGSISSIKETELLKIPSFNAAQSLQGKVAGVQVYNSSGAPGASPVVRVRGVGTFNNSSPIYVVDGVILDDISFLNSADIQSMEVLKDASSTAIFGSRGANGVIIITTKQGKIGQEKAVVNFTSEYSLQQVGKTIDMVNGKQFGALTNEIIPGTYNNLNALPNTDWQNLIFRTAPIQNYQLSVNGASSKSAKDVVIVPTPGHTYGHQSVILKEFDRELFFAGDATYKYEQVWSAEVPGISIDRSCARDTLGKIQRFCLEHAACYLPSHDQNSIERFFFAHQPVRATG